MKNFMKTKNPSKTLCFVIASLILASCSKKVEVEVPGLTDTGGQFGSNGLLVSGIGVHDFFSINRKFSQQTLVPYTNGTVNQSWNNLKGSLAQDSHPSGVNGNGLLSLGKLAGVYCNEAFNNPTQHQLNGVPVREIIMPGYDFTRNPSQAFTSTTKPQIVARLMDHFWGVGLARPEGSEAQMLELLDSLSSNIETNQNNSGMTGNILVGLCTAMLISFNNLEL